MRNLHQYGLLVLVALLLLRFVNQSLVRNPFTSDAVIGSAAGVVVLVLAIVALVDPDSVLSFYWTGVSSEPRNEVSRKVVRAIAVVTIALTAMLMFSASKG
jgi:hypothetical protein